MTTRLWPPIGTIREAQGLDQEKPAQTPPTSGVRTDAVADLPSPLLDLIRRRRHAHALSALPVWREGHLLRVVIAGRVHGVLLNRPDARGKTWSGWLTSAEVDWAGPFDVLLEPEDEPFEPSFGLVQVWNPVELVALPDLDACVVGSISANRLAALRSVADECWLRRDITTSAEPGHIALRVTSAGWTVLTGTPLGESDPRQEYQAIYRDVAAQLTSAVEVSQKAHSHQAHLPSSPATAWQRITRWFGVDQWVRPAFAALLVVFMIQGAGWWLRAEDPDDVRFREVPGRAEVIDPVSIKVRLRADTKLSDLASLMRALKAQGITGPDAKGRWHFSVPDPEAARRALSASPFVESIEMP